MKTKTYLTYALLCCALVTIVFSCSKDKISAENTSSNKEVEANPKIIKFLSITLGVSSDEVEFSPEKDAFIIRTHKYDIKEITEIYNNSNDYQARHENNQ